MTTIEHEAWRLVGTPRFGGVLVISDHASNRVPADIDLGIAPALLDQHIAVDVGVREIGEIMARREGYAAFQCNVSRLVADCNREEHGPTVCPIASDGHAIPGNALDHAGHEQRLSRFYRPYHAALAKLVEDVPQSLMLSLHSFTPHLASRPEVERPWQCGVLYNEDDRAARIALRLLAEEGLNVGDQLPYSGKLLNETMNRHAEADGRPYFGIEIRQDLIATPAGHAEWGARLVRVCNRVALEVAE